MLDLSHIPYVDIGTADCLNLVRRFRDEMSVFLEEADADLRFNIQAESRMNDESKPVTVIFYAPFGTIALSVEDTCVDLLSDYLLPGWADEDPEDLPLEWRAVYVFEQITKRSCFGNMQCFVINVLSPGIKLFGPSALHASLQAGDRSFGVSVSMEVGLRSELEELIPPPKLQSADLSGLLIKLDPVSFGPKTKYELLSKLSPGDVLILPDCKDGAFPLTLKLLGAGVWQGQCDELGNFTLSNKGN